MVLSDVQIAQYAKDAWGITLHGNEISTAVAIALAESKGDPKAVSPVNSDGTRDHGLFQINDIHRVKFWSKWSERYDPAVNAQMAASIYKGWGHSFGAWTTYKNGAYKQYLDRGRKAAATVNASSPVPTIPGLPDVGSILPGTPEWLKGLDTLFDPKNWARAALVVIGFALLLVGVWQIARETDTYKVAVSTVKSVATIGILK